MKRILLWWQQINWRTRLISLLILLIALLMSSWTFFVLLQIRYQSVYTDSSFCKDLSSILAINLIYLFNKSLYSQKIIDLLETTYLNTSVIAYLQLFNDSGDIVFSMPCYDVIFQNILFVKNEKYTLNTLMNLYNIDYVFAFQTHIIDFSIPLFDNKHYLGLLKLGFNTSFRIAFLSFLFQCFSVSIFVSIWLMFILGALFNSLFFTEPINRLLSSMNSITAGNFENNIELFCSGQLSDLIIGFNKMSKRLRLYEKKNVEQLISEKAKLETLTSVIADGVILLDIDLRLLIVNQVAIKIFHWFNKDLIGVSIFRYLPSYVNQAFLSVLNKMIKANYLEGGQFQTQEIKISLNYESLKEFRFFFTTIVDQKYKNLMGFVVTIQDITRETQLNDAKNRFISNVSHELRTPLCNIGSFLETLIDYDHKLSNQQKNQFLIIAYTETKRLNRLVNDVLDLSRLDVERNYILKSMQLVHAIIYIIKLYQIMALNKKIEIVPEISVLVNKIIAHETSLCQVLSNLISNSLKFTHAGGRIIIRVYPLNVYMDQKSLFVRVEIIDEGIGINKMFFRQIFDRFMRIENHIHILEGTGLGLSIVKSIIKKHKSDIYVYSEVNIGTSFWFDLLIDNKIK